MVSVFFIPFNFYSINTATAILGKGPFCAFFPAESQVTITTQPSSPLRVLEGRPLTLEWTYSLERSVTLRRWEFGIAGEILTIVDVLFNGDTYIADDRVTVNITGTNVTITFLALNRNDSNHYIFRVFGSGFTSDSSDVEIIVECK